MRVPRSRYLYEDLDFFAVDSVGNVGHFTSFGSGCLPEVVAEDAQLLAEALHWFGEVCTESGNAEAKGYEGDGSPEAWLSFARKGLYSFDAMGPEIETQRFRLIASPSVPIRADDLPSVLRSRLPVVELGWVFSSVTELPVFVFGKLAR